MIKGYRLIIQNIIIKSQQQHVYFSLNKCIMNHSHEEMSYTHSDTIHSFFIFYIQYAEQLFGPTLTSFTGVAGEVSI